MRKLSTVEVIGAIICLLLISIYLVLSEMLTLEAIRTLRERGLIEPDFDKMKKAKVINDDQPDLDLSNGIKEFQ